MLLIDVGNTRLKWAFGDGDRISPSDSVVHGGDFERALGALHEALDARPERIVVANVAGPRFAVALDALLATRPAPAAEFVATTAETCGLRCGYRDPRRLGVDRWVAAIGAYRRVRGAVCVVDAGTTITFDAVDAGGQHLGGLIFAGPTLAAATLHRGTHGIGATTAAPGRPRGLDLLGRDTSAAVSQAAMLGVAAGIERACATVAHALGVAPAFVLTGGDAPRLVEWLETTGEIRADLVLEGLAVVAAREQT